jgi:lactate dehydrogenase-like 2-hydroxyacid dehydrogenase
MKLGVKAMADKADVLFIGAKKPVIVDGLSPAFNLRFLADAKDKETFLSGLADRIRGFAVSVSSEIVDGPLMARFPKLEIVSTFAVGYDHVDAKWAGAHGIVVTNTPDVLTEEVADTALGLLLCTVRELPQAERYLRAGKWPQKAYRLSPATLRNRTVGMIGMGAIGRAIARRLDAFKVPVVYHTRRARADLPYRYYPDLIGMARDVDILLVIVPGGTSTQNMINAQVLDALGPDGIFINMARGSVVDEPALIKALQEKRIFSAGLDVYANEPHVPNELIEMDNVVLFPHLGSASEATRRAMDRLVVDNLLAWGAGKPPLTPVPETPWPPKKSA